MIVLVFFGIVICFALALTAIDKIHSYNNTNNRSLWMDGDSVVVKPKDAQEAGGGFGKRIGA